MQNKIYETIKNRENEQHQVSDTPVITTPDSDFPEKLNDLIGAFEKGSDALGISVATGIKQFRRLLQVAERMMSKTSSEKITNFAFGHSGDVLLAAKNSCDAETSLENAICGAVGGLAQVGADVFIARFLKLVKIPYATGVSMYQASLVRATAGAVYGVNAQHATSYFASLVGDLAEKACHKAFEIERARQNGRISNIIPPDFSHCVGAYYPPLPVSVVQKTTNAELFELSRSFKQSDYLKKAPRFINNPQLDPMILQTRNDWEQQTREPLDEAPHVLSNDDIRQQKKRTQCIYVITEQGDVLISRREHYIRVDSYGNPLQITHADLAHGSPVIGAGIVVIKDGKIHSLNEDSGHYRPHDGDATRSQFVSLKTIVENAFMARGLVEADGKFYYSHGYESDNPPIYPSETTTPLENVAPLNLTTDYQNLPSVSCVRDRLKHKFVTPDYVLKDDLKKENGLLLYAITDKGKLILARKNSLSRDERGHVIEVSHIDLTRGKKIISAGMLKVKNGEIVEIDYHAPDYESINSSSTILQNALKHIFSEYGFPEIKDTFAHNILDISQHSPSVSNRKCVNEKTNLSLQSIFAAEHIPLYETASRESKPRLNPSSSNQQLIPIDIEAKKTAFQQIRPLNSRPQSSGYIAERGFKPKENVSKISMFRVSSEYHDFSSKSEPQTLARPSEKIQRNNPHHQVCTKINDNLCLAWDDSGAPFNVYK